MTEGLPLPFDDLRRRRIFLMRHAEADYFDKETGRRRPDPRIVPLTAHGRNEAAAMANLLKDAPFDRAICSGLPRTKETAQTVLGDRGIPLEIVSDLEEIRGGTLEQRESMAPADYAYTMFKAHEPNAAWAMGERFADFEKRVLPAFQAILQQTNWAKLLLVCHGGVNRAILNSLLGTGLNGYGFFEQDSCCLNVVDLDMHPSSGKVERTIFRGINITASDPARVDSTYLSVERLALQKNDGTS